MVSSNTPRKTKIFVGRLPENCRNDELRQLFLRFGEVTECDVMNRYGFVHMAREEDAAAAIKALHNSNFKGATINVEQSTGKSRGGAGGGRRDGDRRGGPMRGGRGGRDGGRDGRPGPYNDRRVLPIQIVGYDGSATGGVAGGYTDYGNRGGGDFSGRGGEFGGGYNDRGAYGQNVGGATMGGYTSTAPGMGGGYGPAGGTVGGYGPTGTADYGRATDYARGAEFGARTDFGNRGGFGCDPTGPVDYGRTDNFGGGRAVDYAPRNDYDRGAAGPMRNGGGGVATGGYATGYGDVGGYPSGPGDMGLAGGPVGVSQGGPTMSYERRDGTSLVNDITTFNRPISGGPSYSTGPGGPSYSTGPGPQTDMFSRRPGNTVPSGGYPPVGGGYNEGYDRPDAYGPPRGGGRFPGPADAMPPRY